MTRAVLGLGAALILAGSEPGIARAQQRPIVRGVVRSGGEAVPFAVVGLAPGFGQRFTDDSGTFTFSGIPPGTYRLSVRQVGFRPFDTTLVKVGDQQISMAVDLERLAVELSTITVTAARRCVAPGLVDSAASPELAAVFEQLKQNAERYAFLADSYPFRYRLERTFRDFDQSDKVLWSAVDTMEYQSNARVRYTPGDVVGWGPGPQRRRDRMFRLPMLSDLADSVFEANHCFSYAGIVRGDSGRVVRFQFAPDEDIQTPDIQGVVDLDPSTYQIRRATIELTHAPRALEGLISASDVILFREMYPNIVIPERVQGTLVPAPRFGVQRPVVRRTETQRLLAVHFMRPLPGRSGPGP